MKKEVEMKKLTKLLKQWPVRKKLLISHGSIIVLTFATIVALLAAIFVMESKVSELFERPTKNAFYVGDLRYAALNIEKNVNHLLASGPEKLEQNYDEFKTELTESYAMVDTAAEFLHSGLLTEKERQVLADLEDCVEETKNLQKEMYEYIGAGDYAAALTYHEDIFSVKLDEMLELANELDVIVINAGENYTIEAKTTAFVILGIGVIALICITAYAMIIAAAVTKEITEPVKQITEVAELMYQGDLTASDKITFESRDELGELAETMKGTIDTLAAYVNEISDTLAEISTGDLTKSFNDITDFRGNFGSIKDSFSLILRSFNSTLTQIENESSQVDSGSDEIAHAANDLAEGTSEQASAVEELTATVNTVTAMAENSAKETAEAYENVLRSVKEAEIESRQM